MQGRPNRGRRVLRYVFPLAVFVALLTASGAQAAAGELDPTFGVGGKVVTTIDGLTFGTSRGLAVQPDGKIVVAGGASSSSEGYFVVLRYNADGSLDSSFGSNGVARTVVARFSGATAVALQPDGRIVAVGVDRIGDQSVFALVRYNADGSPDESFGSGGIVRTPIGQIAVARTVALQPDGRIVVGGRSGESTAQEFTVARYLPDGSLDGSFGSGGLVTMAIGVRNAVANDLALQPNGRIVAAGYSEFDGEFGATPAFEVVRYMPDGSLDPSFGAGGMVRTFVCDGGEAHGVVIQPDGRIVAGGTTACTDPLFALVRYLPDGSIDTSFGRRGQVITVFFGSAAYISSGDEMALQPDGRILLSGWAEPFDGSAPEKMAVARYLADGSVDASFGAGGLARVSFESGVELGAQGMALQPEGRVLLAGSQSGALKLARLQGGPETLITSGPPVATNATAASFAFASDVPGSSFQCRLDTAPWQACTSPAGYSGLSEGTHSFAVRAIDPSGSVDLTPARRQWHVDLIPPDTTLTSTPAAISRFTQARFSFASEAGASFLCRLDAGSWTACINPWSYSGLSEGPHSFAVAAVDRAGNVDPTPAGFGWRIDSVAPLVQPPVASFLVGSTVGIRVLVRETWSASDPAPASGIASFGLLRHTDGAGYEQVELTSPTLATLIQPLDFGHRYRYASQAYDRAGNPSLYGFGPAFLPTLAEEQDASVTYSGNWTQAQEPNAHGGAYRYATAAGASASYTFAAASAVAFSAQSGPDEGRCDLYLDGIKLTPTPLDLYTPATQWRKLLFTVPTDGAAHSLQVRVLGTKNPDSAGTRVPVDAFLTLALPPS